MSAKFWDSRRLFRHLFCVAAVGSEIPLFLSFFLFFLILLHLIISHTQRAAATSPLVMNQRSGPTRLRISLYTLLSVGSLHLLEHWRNKKLRVASALLERRGFFSPSLYLWSWIMPDKSGRPSTITLAFQGPPLSSTIRRYGIFFLRSVFSPFLFFFTWPIFSGAVPVTFDPSGKQPRRHEASA